MSVWSSGEKMYLCVDVALVLRRCLNFLIEVAALSSLREACSLRSSVLLLLMSSVRERR